METFLFKLILFALFFQIYLRNDFDLVAKVCLFYTPPRFAFQVLTVVMSFDTVGSEKKYAPIR